MAESQERQTSLESFEEQAKDAADAAKLKQLAAEELQKAEANKLQAAKHKDDAEKALADTRQERADLEAEKAARFKVEQIRVGDKDQRGAKIGEVYAVSAGTYAVYRVGHEVLVQFADAPSVASEQRKRVASLGKARTELDAMAGGWFWNDDVGHRELAKALQDALEGDVDSAKERIQRQIAALTDRKLRRGRYQYVVLSALWLATMLALLYLFSEVIYPEFTLEPKQNVWLAAKGGVVGAFASIAVFVYWRSVAPTDNWGANLLESGLRLSMGVIFAGLALLIVGSGLVQRLVGGDLAVASITSWQSVVVLGFLCGFLERLVPQMLDKTAAATAAKASEAADASATAKAAAASRNNTTGTASTSNTTTGAAATVSKPAGQDLGAEPRAGGSTTGRS